MFQRLKGSIDRVIAEEQARQKTVNDQADPVRRSASVSRSNSGASSARRPRPKKQGQEALRNDDGAADTDPAVFEAAFIIDDDEPSRATTPRPPTDEKAPQNGDSSEKGEEGGGNTKDLEKNGDDEGRSEADKPAPPPKPTATSELPPEVRARLRKLEKLEATYPG